jgi:hypothetical protein
MIAGLASVAVRVTVSVLDQIGHERAQAPERKVTQLAASAFGLASVTKRLNRMASQGAIAAQIHHIEAASQVYSVV